MNQATNSDVNRDQFGGPVAGTATSVAAWNDAWRCILHASGDPIAALTAANAQDETFAMGSVVVALYTILGGAAFDDPLVVEAHRRVTDRVGDDERGHLEALDHLVQGNFTRAAHCWDEVAAQHHDFAAVRFAHDVYLHIGDDEGRLRSSEQAMRDWPIDRPGGSYVAGQYAFALEERGRFTQAERVGKAALEADSLDMWARHALAHVYESTDDQGAALALLEPSLPMWRQQDALATHLWWHLALRYLSVGAYDKVLDVYDEISSSAVTAFRLCDATSLLWRMELAGGPNGGDRWDELADRWADVNNRHNCAFVDLHAVLAYVRRPEHPAATAWIDGVLHARDDDPSENGETFRTVLRPVAEAMLAFGRGDFDTTCQRLDPVWPHLHRLGGSIAQRDLVNLTYQLASKSTGAPTGGTR